MRCVPQVHGVVHDTLAFVRGILTIEMNSATDNPVSVSRMLECFVWHGLLAVLGKSCERGSLAVHLSFGSETVMGRNLRHCYPYTLPWKNTHPYYC